MSTADVPHPAAGAEPAATKRQVTTKQIVAAIIAVVVLVAILQNTRDGHFSFLFFDFNAPTWICIVVTYAAGVVTGLLVARSRARKKAARAA